MPQLDPTYFSTQLFWLLLTIVPLYFVLRRAVLPRITGVLAARQRHIDADLEKASGLRQEADAVLAEYEKALSEARNRAAEAVKKAADEMAAESASRHEAFGKDLAAKTRDAEARIAEAKQQALEQVTAVAGEVAAAATAKLIGAAPAASQVEGAVKDAMEGRG
jgi:F-type H+-transporting ATPase subunit b